MKKEGAEMITSDFLFRMIFLLCVVVFFIFRATRRRQPDCQKNEGQKIRKRDGPSGVIRNRIIYPLWLTVMILYPFNLTWMNYFALPYYEWIRWFGVGLAALSLPLFWWAHNALDRYFSPELKLLSDHKLILSGPYAWIRHPMYAIEFFIFISACLISANLLVTLPNIAATISLCLRTKKEERMLIERFGEHYLLYMKTTRKFFPRFSK